MTWIVFAIGSGLGIVAGVAHAIAIQRRRTAAGLRDGGMWQLYRTIWVLVLWVLFGGYLLLLWVVGLLLWPLLRLFGRRRIA